MCAGSNHRHDSADGLDAMFTVSFVRSTNRDMSDPIKNPHMLHPYQVKAAYAASACKTKLLDLSIALAK